MTRLTVSCSEHRDCKSGKAGFATIKAARTALNDCKKRRGKTRRRHERSFYKCKLCGFLHLTSNLPGDTRFT